jgi:hypothetical protein
MVTATRPTVPGTASVQVFLPKGALVRSRGGVALRVLAGRLWITRSGELDDNFVSTGEHIDLPAGGKALIEADFDARVELRSLRAGYEGGGQPRLTITPQRWIAE